MYTRPQIDRLARTCRIMAEMPPPEDIGQDEWIMVCAIVSEVVAEHRVYWAGMSIAGSEIAQDGRNGRVGVWHRIFGRGRQRRSVGQETAQ